jgi:branched-chain amino acid transport system permease protein
MPKTGEAAAAPAFPDAAVAPSLARPVSAALALLLLVLLPGLIENVYYMRVVATLFFNVALAVLLWAVFVCGLLNMAQIAFLAIGAFTTAVLTIHFGWSFWAVAPVSAVTSALVALVLGYIVLRLRGAYFFLISFALLEVTRLFFNTFFVDFFGGTTGLAGVPAPPSVGFAGFSLNLAGPQGHYYLTLLLMLLSVTLVWQLKSSRVGLILKALSQSDSLAESVGISPLRYRLLTFVSCMALVGVAGSFYAQMNMVVQANDYGLGKAVLIVVHMVIGGTGSIWGPVVGAAVVTFLGEWLRGLGALQQLGYGLMLMLVMIFVPGGLISIPGRLSRGIARLSGRR